MPPEQHACPDAPQVLIGATQRPPWQSAVPSHALPAQQAWPTAPQVADARHVPPMHSAPRSQVVPLQQG